MWFGHHQVRGCDSQTNSSFTQQSANLLIPNLAKLPQANRNGQVGCNNVHSDEVHEVTASRENRPASTRALGRCIVILVGLGA